MSSVLRKIPSSKLFVSEPHPSMFGNGPNPKNPSEHGWTNANWLKSRFHFSFAEYRNSRVPPFGCLYVCNDDLVQPRTGFGTHPHRDMEIVTYVVEGELSHADSNGNSESLGRGSVQFMSAGTGVYHSEENKGDKPCRFIQAWILPEKRGLKPNYGSYNAPAGDKFGWKHLVTSNKNTQNNIPVKVAQDVDILVDIIPPHKSDVLELKPTEQAYLLCLEGSIKFAEQKVSLDRHEAAEVYGPAKLQMETRDKQGHVIMYKMKRDPSSGRTDI